MIGPLADWLTLRAVPFAEAAAAGLLIYGAVALSAALIHHISRARFGYSWTSGQVIGILVRPLATLRLLSGGMADDPRRNSGVYASFLQAYVLVFILASAVIQLINAEILLTG